MLTDAAISKKVDILSGLKENVIMGHQIPAGTGLIKYAKLRVKRPDEEEEELARDFKITMPVVPGEPIEDGDLPASGEVIVQEKRQDV